jgi:hypothetical protein
VVETIRLESGHTLTGIVGSNTTLSANVPVSSRCGYRGTNRAEMLLIEPCPHGRLHALLEPQIYMTQQKLTRRTPHEMNLQEIRHERNAEQQRIEKLKKRIELAQADQRSKQLQVA